MAKTKSPGNDNDNVTKSLEELDKIIYPTDLAPREDIKDQYQGQNQVYTVADPYRFLEDPESLATTKWVNAQNKLFNDFVKKLNYKDKAKQKMKQLNNHRSMSIP